MNWVALGAIAELLGAIGVIATLLYLSQQVQMLVGAVVFFVRLRLKPIYPFAS